MIFDQRVRKHNHFIDQALKVASMSSVACLVGFESEARLHIYYGLVNISLASTAQLTERSLPCYGKKAKSQPLGQSDCIHESVIRVRMGGSFLGKSTASKEG
jgi:hypothetical protein